MLTHRRMKRMPNFGSAIAIPPGGVYIEPTKKYPTGRYISGVGHVLINVHPETDECASRGCSIHSPSSHSMRDFRTLFRRDRMMIERICPCGIGHPDPDHLSFIESVYGAESARIESIHGCCGHCSNVTIENLLGNPTID